MDDPALDSRRHAQALRGLARINRWSRSARILWSPIRDLTHKSQGRILRVLDIATGGGDVCIQLWRLARRAGLPIEFAACDRSHGAITFARQRAHAAGAAIHFFICDCLSDPIPQGYDVVMTSLFLHHLDDEKAVRFLTAAGESAGKMLLVNDLLRSRRGLFLAYVGTRLLSASDVVHNDGPLSVRAACTRAEAEQLAQAAGLRNAVVQRKWPCRFLMIWRRP